MAIREFQMSQAQYNSLLKSCEPQMYIVANGTEPDVRGAILRAWDALGNEMGFVGDTAMPIDGKPHQCFTAVAK